MAGGRFLCLKKIIKKPIIMISNYLYFCSFNVVILLYCYGDNCLIKLYIKFYIFLLILHVIDYLLSTVYNTPFSLANLHIIISNPS